LDEICDFITENHTYTKTYINGHKGEYPVYSATLGEPYGNIDTYDYKDIKVMVVVNYGSSGQTYIINDSKFSIGRNICGLYIKEEYKETISLEYLRIVSTPILINKAKGEKQKNLNNLMIKETQISMPVKGDGTFDYDKQVELAGIYEQIDKQKEILLKKLDELEKMCVVVELPNDIKFENVKLNKLFTPKGGSMKYSKKWCNEHQGEHPVYSGSTNDIFAFVNEAFYKGTYLTWVIDGLAGYIKKVTGEFNIMCHRGILIPKEGIENIDLDYLKYVLEPKFRAKKRGRIGINDKNEYTALKPTHIVNFDFEVPIPVNQDGTYNLEAQKDIAVQYKTINDIKEYIKEKINLLVGIVVE